MAEEKFISIEYNTWLTKYKPMEDKLIEQAKKIEELEEKTTVDVHLLWYSYHSRYDKNLGVIELMIENSPVFKIFDKSILKNAIYDTLREVHMYSERVFLTRDDLKEYDHKLKELTTLQSKLTKEHNARLDESKALKAERIKLEQDKAAIRLPKFLNKLFNLK